MDERIADCIGTIQTESPGSVTRGIRASRFYCLAGQNGLPSHQTGLQADMPGWLRSPKARKNPFVRAANPF
jgi:hypothetical protein